MADDLHADWSCDCGCDGDESDLSGECLCDLRPDHRRYVCVVKTGGRMFETGNDCGVRQIATGQLDPCVWVLPLEWCLAHPRPLGPRVNEIENHSAEAIPVEIQIVFGNLLSFQRHCFTSQSLVNQSINSTRWKRLKARDQARKGHT